MTNFDAEQLVRQTIEPTGAAAPELLEEDSPVLAGDGDGGIYLIGLIGGKEVGKSAR